MIPDPAPPFELDASGLFRERTRRMLARARELGVGPQVERAVAEIFLQLRQRPRDWGDPVRDFRNLNFVEYHGRHAKLPCVYSVHVRIPTVVITRLVPQDGHPLFGEDFDAP
jgi:hypothetical protein